ncbi:MAG: glycosyltransferase family 2 protein [Chloroflexi bacterium]|nr:glycosyltransferase family 2 protein [Chloroflexota bacterium]
MSPLTFLLVAIVMLGAIAPVVGTWQILLAGAHAIRNHFRRTGPCLPRTVVVLPAWNEAQVIGATIDRVLGMDYPADRLRIMVVDDASTDATPEVIAERAGRYPGQVLHVRTEQGGQGKAHALNHGLERVLADDWAEAILIADADVQFEPGTLRRMARHLADPQVGAVTGYIKEGSHEPGYLNRFIAWEYLTAQAASRRTQDVLGGMACLAGGAQLHARGSLEAIGGRIDTSTLAEDTVATFETQLVGRRAIFEPHGVVWAEEPPDLRSLWKQRIRWSRGNLQVTRRYRGVWFRPWRRLGLSGITFGLAWFTVLLQPLLMIAASSALLVLLAMGDPHAWPAFRALWVTTALCYLFLTLSCLVIDRETARVAWREGVLFPGVVSVAIVVYTCVQAVAPWEVSAPGPLAWVLSAWLAGCMGVAWLAMRLESAPGGRWWSRGLIYLAGYGAFLCLVTLVAYVRELRGAERRWEKTEKHGRALMRP